jgi:hypothetical protein
MLCCDRVPNLNFDLTRPVVSEHRGLGVMVFGQDSRFSRKFDSLWRIDSLDPVLADIASPTSPGV